MSCLSPQPGCILAARLKLGNNLGEGEFGSVFKGTYQLDDETTVNHDPSINSLTFLLME